MKNNYELAWKGQKIIESHCDMIGPNGIVRHMVSNVSVKLRNSDVPMIEYTRAVSRDDAERKLLEDIQVLKQKATMAEKMRLIKDTIVRGILHELKTPAQVFFSLDSKGQSTDDNQELELARDCLDGVLKDILIVTDEAVSAAESQNHHVKLTKVMEKVVKLSHLSIPAGLKMNILVNSSADINLLISDCGTIERAIYHMIRNAVMFSRDDSDIVINIQECLRECSNLEEKGKGSISDHFLSVTVSNFSTSLTQQIEHLLIDEKVIDSKTMLELNKKNKLGDVVNMLEPRLFEGFGLNITQRVADMIGGTVTYTLDEPSCYVSISFHIPDNYLVSQSSSIKEATSETKMSSRSYSFLIVEDSLPIQKVMTGSLEKLGHVCVCANNGQDALNKLHSRNEDDMFDLIVMDLRMPIMDGLTATQIIRQDKNEIIRNTPIVVVSADCTSLVKESVLKAGANAFYDKPVPISAILRFLEKI